MAFLTCFWMKRRLAPYLDGALSGRRGRAVVSHLQGCPGCRGEVSRLERLRELLRSTLTVGPDPDWTGFWGWIRGRILSERPRRRREAWGWSPRVALGGALGGVVAGVLLLVLLLWPVASPEGPALPAGVVVNTVETAHPNGNVMVFSSPEDEMTVIWVFGLEQPGDQSQIRPVSLTGDRG